MRMFLVVNSFGVLGLIGFFQVIECGFFFSVRVFEFVYRFFGVGSGLGLRYLVTIVRDRFQYFFSFFRYRNRLVSDREQGREGRGWLNVRFQFRRNYRNIFGSQVRGVGWWQVRRGRSVGYYLLFIVGESRGKVTLGVGFVFFQRVFRGEMMFCRSSG